MPTLTIQPRRTRSQERRYEIFYRLGGRGFPLLSGGTFKTRKLAKVRRDWIANEIASGRDPRDSLRAVAAGESAPAQGLTMRTWSKRYLDSRRDVSPATFKNYQVAVRKVDERFGDVLVSRMTSIAVDEWVGELAAKHKPGTVGQYVQALRAVLDYAGVEPNPARNRRIRLPKLVNEEPHPPTAEHVAAIIETVGPKWRLLLVTLEQSGMRIGEAISLRWRDVDAAGNSLRLPRSATKRNRSRWVQLPPWLMEALEESCPLEDRVPDRRVFLGLDEDGARRAMARACRDARVTHYSPHDLRHRRLSLWHHAGVPARELADRAGHSKASMSLDTYSHTMPVDEVSDADFAELLNGR